MRLFNGVANIKSIIKSNSNFVGLLLVVKQPVTIKISNVFLQITKRQGVQLYLYHESKEEAISINPITGGWNEVSIELSQLSDEHESGGRYLLGYYQAHLFPNVNALAMPLDWTKAPCKCDGKWTEWYKEYNQVLHVRGFSGRENPVIDNNSNFGLNLEFEYERNSKRAGQTT